MNKEEVKATHTPIQKEEEEREHSNYWTIAILKGRQALVTSTPHTGGQECFRTQFCSLGVIL